MVVTRLKPGSDRLQQEPEVRRCRDAETRLIASVRESGVRSEKGFIYSFIFLDAVLHKCAISCKFIYVVGVNGDFLQH
ncbi:MAG: hypothetical protein KME22_26285 [Hassallia sp. WJT32-NPBG1]|nr:hypothetical protein [Hassallia sp. WJT32-NPBG1]